MQSNDVETQQLLVTLSDQERVKNHKVPGVRTVLVVISSRGMVFDRDSLRQKILLTYPDASVFFMTQAGQTMGPEAPKSVDLLIDFTGPGQRQAGFLFPRTLRGRARVAVGRNAGWLRAHVYDRVFDERAQPALMAADLLLRERLVQKEVLALAGVPLSLQGDTPRDLGQTIALQLPTLGRL